jgi:ubiquinone/menaquinone biosynthesis C-methylase UbiE/uncharacterized protein YbaR (Trm112 family)
MTNQEREAFNREKIYEKLDYAPEPPGYESKVPWIVQQQIAATNGVHYIDRIGKLKEYPIYELPAPRISAPGIMLDIGNGWGRWLVAGGNKGNIPVGVDIRLEFAGTAQRVLADMGIKGYNVVADLENLPFQDNVFDLVWSFSVIQHTHLDRLRNCLGHINRVLNGTGITFLEFPNKSGIRNRFGPVKQWAHEKDDYNSWCVRYYSIKEYREIFSQFLDGFQYRNHSFLGIGVLKEDLKYVSFKNKILCMMSLTGSALTKVIPGLKSISDSIYISGHKKNAAVAAVNPAIGTFVTKHKSGEAHDNLHVVNLLRCPKHGGTVMLSADRKQVVAKEAGVWYPVENNIPIMIASEARPV